MNSAAAAEPAPVVNFFDLTRPALVEFFEGLGEKRFRAEQVLKWVYHRGVTNLDGMTDLSKALRTRLRDRLEFRLPEVVSEAVSRDGTRKWAIRVNGGNLVETVLIPDRGRNTLCVSSQAGCVLDCSFCSTGKQGFSANLTTAEIIGQVFIANQRVLEEGGGRPGEERGITNIVMMGMGEPLLNFDQVIPATELMMEDLAFGISKRRVTISTAGVVPAIWELAKVSDVSLAISLHAADDTLRNELVPINRKYPISELLEACNHYVAGLGERRSLTMEYTLMKGVNDSLDHAKALARVLRGVKTKINLIPFNPFPGSGYERPSATAIRDFQTELLNSGYATMLRTTRGDDIDAACGQLVGQVQDRTKRQQRYIARLRDEGSAPVPPRPDQPAAGNPA